MLKIVISTQYSNFNYANQRRITVLLRVGATIQKVLLQYPAKLLIMFDGRFLDGDNEFVTAMVAENLITKRMKRMVKWPFYPHFNFSFLSFFFLLPHLCKSIHSPSRCCHCPFPSAGIALPSPLSSRLPRHCHCPTFIPTPTPQCPHSPVEGKATKSNLRQKQGGGRSHAVVVHGQTQSAIHRDAESDRKAMDLHVAEASRKDRGLDRENKAWEGGEQVPSGVTPPLRRHHQAATLDREVAQRRCNQGWLPLPSANEYWWWVSTHGHPFSPAQSRTTALHVSQPTNVFPPDDMLKCAKLNSWVISLTSLFS